MKRGRFVTALLMGVVAGCGGPAGGAPTGNVAPTSHSMATSSPSPVATTATVGGAAVSDRYPDGLPRTLDGKAVLRGAAALAQAKAATDATPFLIAGWVTWVPGARYCSLGYDGSTWLRDCGTPALSDRAGAQDPAFSNAITFRFVLEHVETGPMVVRVRVHDPRSFTCGSATAQCDRMMVALAIVWTGDDATSPRPLSIDAVEATLRDLHVTTEIVPVGSDRSFPCASDLAGADVYELAAAERVWPIVTTIEIEPSVAARERALDVPAGASGALTDSALALTGFSRTPSASWSEECRWLAISNVALVVRTHHGPNAADRTFLERLAAALERAAASAG